MCSLYNLLRYYLQELPSTPIPNQIQLSPNTSAANVISSPSPAANLLHPLPPIVHPGAAPSFPKVSPIKVPVPPTPSSQLKRSNFTNLAQYLSGSPSTPPPSICVEVGSSPNNLQQATPPTKRRKTTPRRHDPQQQQQQTNLGPPQQQQPQGGVVMAPVAVSTSPGGQSFQLKQQQPTPPPPPPPPATHNHYSGSTSSLTASPASPPHSHSTEGGDDTDR